MKLVLWLLGAGIVLAGVIWRRRFLAQEAAAIDQRIQANRATVRFAGVDDSLRVKTQTQRGEAERLRRRAAQVDSGVPLPERGGLRAVK